MQRPSDELDVGAESLHECRRLEERVPTLRPLGLDLVPRIEKKVRVYIQQARVRPPALAQQVEPVLLLAPLFGVCKKAPAAAVGHDDEEERHLWELGRHQLVDGSDDVLSVGLDAAVDAGDTAVEPGQRVSQPVDVHWSQHRIASTNQHPTSTCTGETGCATCYTMLYCVHVHVYAPARVGLRRTACEIREKWS